MNVKQALMMVFLAACLISPANVRAEQVEVKAFVKYGGPVDMGTCSMTVRFTSYAHGIDEDILSAVKNYVEANADITGPRLYPWGLEGEKTLCFMVPDASKTAAIFAQIKNIMPAHPKRGSITLSTGETSYSVPAPPDLSSGK